MRKAKYFSKEKKRVKCELCPKKCSIKEGGKGICGVRQNVSGELMTLVYGMPCAIQVDPIEKKPFFHFFPGEKTFSIATVGCNLSCSFCQNWQISKSSGTDKSEEELSPEQVIELCKRSSCTIISYTYTEPTIFFEYMIDIAKLAKKEGIKNTMVSNGYINEAPLRELCKYMDAANIDLKSFNDDFYRKVCKGELEPVLNSLKILKSEGVWLEITNLIIPELNDNMKEISEMSGWIAKELGKNVPLHLSGFHPDYNMVNKKNTPTETLLKAKKIASEKLDFVYLGNVHSDYSTYCPKCNEKIIKRDYMKTTDNIMKGGVCPNCKKKISGIWK